MENIKFFLFILPVISIFHACNLPDYTLAREKSTSILQHLKTEDWQSLWTDSSHSFQKEVSHERVQKLEHWVTKELGPLKKYKQTYFYTGSRCGLFGGYFVQIHYDAEFEKGRGEIKIILIEENEDLKLLSIDFTKKPVY